MEWHTHWELNNKHAFLSPSSHYWTHYTPERLRSVYLSNQAKERGTKLHALASDLINMGILLPRSKHTINMFVNDAIRMQMRSEQPLYFSDYCFGTADAILYKDGELHIHDLKTGVNPASMDQLKIYAALFFLEYRVDPNDARIFLRLYQNDEVIEEEADASEIADLMQRIIDFSVILANINEEEA